MERLDKILVNKNYGSRKIVHKLIKDGLVKVDDNIVKDKDIKITSESKITVKGLVVTNFYDDCYIVMNKPKGVVSATKDKDKTVIDLLLPCDFRNDLHLVGRLDKDTTGLLILTTDGNFSSRTLLPNRHVSKKYLVVVDSIITKDDIETFKNGVELSDFIAKPSILEILSASEVKSTCYVTIDEGKFHQIKRMFHKINCEVLELKRVSFGKIFLDEALLEGEYRYFNEAEMLYVKEILS
ncbi:MAG: pseudouridine synthase [Lachnospirales bacterium]